MVVEFHRRTRETNLGVGEDRPESRSVGGPTAGVRNSRLYPVHVRDSAKVERRQEGVVLVARALERHRLSTPPSKLSVA